MQIISLLTEEFLASQEQLLCGINYWTSLMFFSTAKGVFWKINVDY